MKQIKSSIILAFCSLFIFVQTAQAVGFNPNLVITDNQLENTNTMDESTIQSFLLARGSLGIYATTDIDGKVKTAAQIIDRVAKKYNINPQFLIALLQKEQGLVEGKITDKRLNWATGYAVCDNCELGHPLVEKYKGFAKQVEAAADRIRNTYLAQIDTAGKTLTGWGPGITKTASGIKITPINKATAALYTYTPHINGNKLLWSVWERWWGEVTQQAEYPDGSLLQANGQNGVWLIQNGQKRPITSMAALISRFDLEKIIAIDESALDNYEQGRAIKYANFSILQGADGTLYLTRSDTRHPFESEEVFKKLGFSPDEIIRAADEDLLQYDLGEKITANAAYPRGALLQNNKTGGVYFVEDGKKSPIWAKEILTSRFSGMDIVPVTPEELEKYETIDPIGFYDGELVGENGKPTIYVVSNGRLRPIPSAEIFLTVGWKWENVVWTNAKALSIHQIDTPITIEDSPVIVAMN